MDTLPPATPEARFTPDRRYTALAAGGAILAVLVAVFTADRAGALMFAAVSLLLVGYVGTDLYFTPRLTASAAGVVIHSPLLRATLPWRDIEIVRADSRQRLGLRSSTLEVDAGAIFAVFSRRALGADPQDAADLVNAFRPS